MSIPNGTYNLGPDTATLTVRTGKKGAASKAGHNLRMEVVSWTGTLRVEPAGTEIELTADSRSLKVLDGTGGIQPLGEDDKANIEQTIDDEVLQGGTITFRSSAVQAGADGGLTVQGELELLGTRRPLSFELAVADDGRMTGHATVKQTDWGMKPYSALFGTLKVADEVQIDVDGRLPAG